MFKPEPSFSPWHLSFAHYYKAGMRFLPQSAARCRDLWLRPADSTRRWNQTADLGNLRPGSKCSNAPLETVRQLASSAEGDLGTVQLVRSTGDQRSQFGAACCAGNTGVITVFWSGWERGASSVSLLRSGGRRQRCRRPRLRSPLSLACLFGARGNSTSHPLIQHKLLS